MRPQPPARRRVGILGIALAMLAGLLLTIPTLASAKDAHEYTFVFEHTDGTTTTVSGVADKNTAFLANAGGTSKDNPSGMEVHVSCSDEFPGGWGKKDGPSAGADTEWRVKSFTINKGKKACTGGDPVPPARPDVDIEKATNGFDADDPTGPEIPVGDPVTWTYVVTNTGETALTDVRVIDYVPVVGSSDNSAIDCPRDELGIGESMTCEATGTAQLGQYANEAKVLADGEIGTQPAVDGKKKQYTFIFEHPDGTTTRIDGSAEKNEAFLPNAGGTSKNNPTGMTVHVSCSDQFPGGWGKKDGPSAGSDSAWKVQDFFIREVKDGKVKKSCGSPIPNVITVMDQDPSHYIGVAGDPDIDIEKATNGIDADRPQQGPTLNAGDTVEWTYVVTNTGDVDLIDIDVVDDIEGYVGFIGFLAVGDSTTLTTTGIVEEGDYANEGCATGMTEAGDEVDDCDPSHYNSREYGDQPGIDIEKATNGHDADRPSGPRIPVGDRVTWAYDVTNTGALTLYGVYVFDEEEGRVDCPEHRLAAGDTMTCTLQGRARAGQYANEAWVTGWTDLGMVRDSDWSHYYGTHDTPTTEASIDLEKATNGEDADQPTGPMVKVGDTVTWTYDVTNTGEVTLYAIYLYDEGEYVRVHCPERSLAPGASMTCTLEGTAHHGQYANEGWVTAWTGDDRMVRDVDWSHYMGRTTVD